MLWLLGKLIKIIIIVAILGLIAVLIAAFFVNPNNFKSQINNALQNHTGQSLKVTGPIQWTLRPQTKLHLQDVVLNKDDNQSIVLQAKDVTINFDVLSYLTNNLVINDLTLNDVTVDWDQIRTIKQNKPKYKSLIKTLSLKNVSLLSQNKANTINWQLKNSVLTANNLTFDNKISTMAPIKLQGDLVNTNTNAIFNIDTVLKADFTKHALILDPLKIMWNTTPVNGTATIIEYENDLAINGTLSLDNVEIDSILKKLDPYYSNKAESKTITAQTTYSYQLQGQVLDLTNLHLQINNGYVDGNLKISTNSPYQIEFALNSDNMDFSPILLLSKSMFTNSLSESLVPVDFIKNLTVNGKFTSSHLSLPNNLQLDQLNFNVVGQNGIMQVSPVLMVAYGSTHNMSLNIDVINKQQPFFQITEQADNVNLEPWLTMIKETEVINGTASIKASLEAMGNDVATLKQTLTGSINMYVNAGQLYDIDALALVNFTTQTVNDIFNQVAQSSAPDIRALAISKAAGWIDTQKNNPTTKFDSFELKADIDQGVSKKASIAMSNNVVELKGTGGFNINNNTLDFNATLTNKQDINTTIKVLAGYMKQATLPILITGSLQKPIFGPNIQEYAVNIINSAQQDLLTQAITKMVAVTPLNVKTSKTASDLFLDSLAGLSR